MRSKKYYSDLDGLDRRNGHRAGIVFSGEMCYTWAKSTDGAAQAMEEFTDLIVMKKSRKTIQNGDVFVVQPFQDVFYYGKVIQTNIYSRNSCVRGMLLIFIYDKMSTIPQIPYDLDNSDLLIAPTIVNRLGWSRGYFETICNFPITERERNMSFGFWHFQKRCFVDVEGNVLNQKPDYYTDYGLGNYLVVGEKIQVALQKRL